MSEDNAKKYEVGYKCPPAKYKFKKGQSGNPKGRPKLVQDFKTDFQDELEEVISISENGKKKLLTKQRALIKRLVTSALSGNNSSIKLVTAILNSLPVKVDDFEEDLSAQDKQILEEFINRKGVNTNGCK